MPASRIALTCLLPVLATFAVSALSLDGGHAPTTAPAASVRVFRDAPAPAPASVRAPAPAAVATWTERQILDAIRFVESSNRLHPPDGDGGRALGPYQIRAAYWRDAVAACPSLATMRENGRSRPARHEDCRKLAYAEEVVRAFMSRHAADAWRTRQAEVVARVHNGGPAGPRRASTAGYWGRVQTVLATARPR